MPELPVGFYECMNDICASLDGVDGWLSDREAQFLAMVAACPTCDGNILEIGSYRGRSTIALAKGAALSDRATIRTVDILPPDILEENLRNARVRDAVEVFHMPSQQMLADWRRPVRLLWHDGANDRQMVSQDLECVLPYLANRGMIAFHDVLNTSGARIWVYAEKILQNPHVGAVGICGSIGWAQYHANPAAAAAYAGIKRALYRRLRLLYPFYERYTGHRVPWAARVQYKLLRSTIPHFRVDPKKWVRKVA